MTSGQSTVDRPLSVSGTEVSGRVVDRRLARMVRVPAIWVTAIVGASTLVRGAIGLRVPSPWILPDEIVYSELAKSIAAGHRPAVRGVPVFGWGEVYPTLIAPAWALIDDPVSSYHAALGINALMMSLAAVPAYFLARLFVSRRAAGVVAAMTLLVPSMAYTGVLMTENAFYPVFLLSVLLIARAVRQPTLARQALAIAGLVLVAFTRMQGLALVGAYAVAVAVYWLTSERPERAGYARRFVPTAVLLTLTISAPVVASVALGDGPFGWLGSRSGTFAEFHIREVPQWFVYLASDLMLYVAVIPAAASAVVIARGLRRSAPEHVRLFAAVVLPTIAAMLASVALVSASLDVDGRENLNERYVFYVVPLLFCGLALWTREGLPRTRPWAGLVVALSCVLAVVLPVDRLAYNAGFQSVGLLPWIWLSLPSAAVAVVIGAFVLACGALWLTCPHDRTGRFWIVAGIWMALIAALTLDTNARSASNSASAFYDLPATWVDDALPAGANVVALWDERAADPDPPDAFYHWVMVTEFFNPNLGSVYRLGPATHYEGFLPTVPVRGRSDGAVVVRRGDVLRADYVLTTCRTPVAGMEVAHSPRGALKVVEINGPVRLIRGERCTRENPWG